MKTIKKYFKVVFCFLAFAVCSLLMAFAPTMTVVSAASTALNEYKNALEAISMPKSIEAEEGLKIPLLKKCFDSVTNYTIIVTDSAGTTHECAIDSANPTVSGDYFKSIETDAQGNKFVVVTALTDGTYKIVYKVSLGDKTYYSNAYRVEVKNTTYKLDFTKADGSKFLLPKEVKTGTKLELTIPKAKAVDSEDGNGTALDVATEVTVIDGTSKVHVLNATDSDFVSEGTGADTKYYLIANQETTYKVKFTYKDSINRPTVTYTVNATEDFEKPTDFEVSKDPTIKVGKDGVELGKKDIKLPELVAKNSVESDVEYNCDKIVIAKEDDSNVKIELTNNDYTFDMTLEAFNKGLTETDAGYVDSYEDLKGNYVITYTLTDAYGNTTTKSVTIKGVTINSTPTIKLSYDYAVGEEANTVGAETNLKNKYGYDVIMIPAVTVADNIDDNLVVIRAIRNTKTQQVFYVDNFKYNSSTKTYEAVKAEDRTSEDEGDKKVGHTGYNYAEGLNTEKPEYNKAVAFKFDKDGKDVSNYAGTYELEFTVISNALGKNRNTSLYSTGSTKYSFEVLECAMSKYENKDKTDLTVEIGSEVIEEMFVNPNEDLTFNVTASDNDDKRLKTVVYYYYGENPNNGTIKDNIKNTIIEVQGTADDKNDRHILENAKVLEKLGYKLATVNDNGEYVVPFDGYNSEEHTSAVVVAVTYNDYGSVEVDTRTVLFQNTSEYVAPEYEVREYNDLADDSTTFKLGDEIVLPELVFTDAIDEILSTNIMYYVVRENADSITTADYRYPSSKLFGTNVLGGTIVATEAGQHYVVYTATDDAGNTTVVSYTFYVEDTSKPEFSVVGTVNNKNVVNATESDTNSSVEIEVGTEINFNLGVKAYVGTEYTDVTKATKITVDINDHGNSSDVQQSGNRLYSYLFNTPGNYTITFTAEYSDREEATQVINVTVKNPELKWLTEFEIQETAKEEEVVELPDIAASHDAVVTVEVKVNNSTGLKSEVEKVVNDYGKMVWRFETLDKGTYTVIYTATTAFGKLEKEFTIQVGDIVKPTFSMNGVSTLEQDIIYDGNQIEYKLDVKTSGDREFVVTVTSNGKTIYTVNTGLTIYDLDDNGNKTTITDWSEKLTYKLTCDNSDILKEGDKDGQYFISGAGEFRLTLTATDKAGNVATKVIKFNVKNELNVKEDNTDTIVGIVLIVVSLLVLAGVILYFTLTGKKQNKSGKKVKTQKQPKEVSKKVEEKKEVVEVVEEVTEEVAEPEVEEENVVVEESQPETEEETSEDAETESSESDETQE